MIGDDNICHFFLGIDFPRSKGSSYKRTLSPFRLIRLFYLRHISHQVLIFKITPLVSHLLTEAIWLAGRKYDVPQFSVLTKTGRKKRKRKHSFIHSRSTNTYLYPYHMLSIVWSLEIDQWGGKQIKYPFLPCSYILLGWERQIQNESINIRGLEGVTGWMVVPQRIGLPRTLWVWSCLEKCSSQM